MKKNYIIKFMVLIINLILIANVFADEANQPANSKATLINDNNNILSSHYLTVRPSISTNYYVFQALDQTRRTSGFGTTLMYDWWFSKNMAITSGLLYVQKKFNGPVVKFHYLCIDILFKLSTDRSIYFASGFGFDFLIKKNDDIEHKTINRVDITFIFAVGFYLNLWKDKLFLNGEIRARAVLNPLEFVSWGKRRIATTSIEAGITFPL